MIALANVPESMCAEIPTFLSRVRRVLSASLMSNLGGSGSGGAGFVSSSLLHADAANVRRAPAVGLAWEMAATGVRAAAVRIASSDRGDRVACSRIEAAAWRSIVQTLEQSRRRA